MACRIIMTMKRQDLVFILAAAAILLPFFVSEDVYGWYKSFNASHGMIMSFIKFAILSTMGEMIGARISKGSYIPKGFGVAPKMIVWGLLGMGINMAMIIFANGTPVFLEYLGMHNAVAEFTAQGFTWNKLLVAFCVSVAMNSIFAPVFMTLHKITDAHISSLGGSIKAVVTPIRMGDIMASLNWKAQWGFVFKKTIPLFWFPAHTITFMLPGEMRVLCAAILGVILGVLLAIAAAK